MIYAIQSQELREYLRRNRICLVDAGSRGGAQDPWANLDPDIVEVIGFEPDAADCESLNSLAPTHWNYVPTALWSEPGEINLHVAEFPGCSSVHTPNWELLSHFREEHSLPRTTLSVVSVPATTLDDAVEHLGSSPDFIKVDTQGSEYEIMQGARRVMSEQASGLLVETWTTEVHAGQRRTWDVLALAASFGFELFDINVAASWRRRTAQVTPYGKAQVIGLDCLLFRPPRNEGNSSKAIKAALIAAMFGFPDYALDVLRAIDQPTSDVHAARDAIIVAASPPTRSLRTRILGRVSKRIPAFPSLHE